PSPRPTRAARSPSSRPRPDFRSSPRPPASSASPATAGRRRPSRPSSPTSSRPSSSSRSARRQRPRATRRSKRRASSSRRNAGPDSTGARLAILTADAALAAAALAAAVRTERVAAWKSHVAAAAERRRRAVAAELAGAELTEGHVARAVVAALPRGAQLAVGNSLPIRFIDGFAPDAAPDLAILHQRGANGIDGLVSRAAGAAVATGGPTPLPLGDVSLLHDLGGLHTVRHVRAPFTVVCVNNDGGRIFEHLPVAVLPGAGGALAHFTTPHGLGFAAAAAMFGLHHILVETPAQLAAALAAPAGPTLVEARVPPSGPAAQARRRAAPLKEMS